MPSLQSIQSEIRNQLPISNLVVTAPTGWGKSTEIPRSLLCSHNALMIEPRRIATKALAHRISDLEEETVGKRIGYSVRGESKTSPQTKLRIVTPGVAIRLFHSDQFQEYDLIIFDEIHERTLEQDLLLALCMHIKKRVLLLSATIAAQSIAQKVHGQHIDIEGRAFPITLHYEQERGAPRIDNIGARIYAALNKATCSKDVLVFLPGKGEINSAANHLQNRLSSEYELLSLHGGQTLKEQSKVFSPSSKRRIILSTNVAETALTIPNIDLVIDSGLERRTCYHQGRSFLALFPIAMDSAEQRKGRAGRMGPGSCIRLWGSTEKLNPQTPPQIFREALEPILLGAAMCAKTDVFALPFLDPPTKYAVEDAQEYLRRIGAFDAQNVATDLGKRLFQLPIDHALGRLLIEAKSSGLLKSIIPLCAALSVRGAIFKGIVLDDDDENIRTEHCDLRGLIRAMLTPSKQVYKQAYQDGRSTMKRLQDLWNIEECAFPENLEAIAQCIIRAWPSCVHVRRKRGKRWAWSNGGTEKEKGSNCGVQEEKTEAVIVLSTFSQGRMARERTSWIEYAMPVPIPWLAKATLGRPKLHRIYMQDGVPIAELQRIYAGKNIETTEEPPPKEVLTEAMTELFTRGSWEKEWLREAKQRHRIHSIASMLRDEPPVLGFVDYIAARIASFELESAEDVALLNGEDLLPPQELLHMRDKVQKDYPESFSIGDAGYDISYDVPRKTMRFIQTKGTRKTAPPLSMCPRKAGWKYIWVYKNREFPL